MSFFDDASLVFLPSGQAGKDGKAYSMKPTDGSGDFTFSRGSNLTATRVDSNGLIEKGRENLLKQSNQFDTTWVGTSGVSVTDGQSGYDGTNDAWLLSKSVTEQYSRVQQTIPSVSGVYTCSVYAKENTLSIMGLRNGSSADRVLFDLSGSGSIDSQVGNIVYKKIESVGNGWFRCQVVFSDPSDQFQIYVDWSEADAGSIYIQDAQLEQGLVATEYIESGASTGLAGILEDSPRFDYSGGATCPSLLLEPSRTNLIGYSEYFEASDWNTDPNGVAISADVTTNYATSPQGLKNATRLRLDLNGGTTNSDRSRIKADFGIGTSGSQVHSIYIKSNDGVTQNVTFRSLGTLTNHEITSDWKRIDLVSTDNSLYFELGIYGNTSYNNTADLLIWGAQIEEGSYPTSYIPNHSGGSVTREGDDSTLSSIINGDAAFTFMIESGIQDYGSSVPKYFDAGALGYINHNTSNILRYRFGGSNYVQSISGLDSFKFLLRYDRSEIKVYFNGSLEHTISASLSGSIGLSLLGGLNKQVLLFPSDLPDNQCITLTS